MSLTVAPMGVLLLLEKRGLLGAAETVCDFGSMEFDAREPSNNPVFEAIFRGREKEIPPSFYDAETGRMYGTVGDLWRALGWDYMSYDIDGRFGSMTVDLNVDQVPESEREKYSLTMNGGTSEHVFNQYNFFLQFHNVTQVGGLMMHVVPFHLLHNHGLYSYSPTFFHSLAKYNGYETLGLWQCGKPHHYAYFPSSSPPQGRRVTLIALMRRTRPGDFVFPLQVNEPMVLSPEAQERYGAFTPQALDTFRPSGDLPEEFWVDVPTATVHEEPVPAEQLAAAKGAAKAAKVAKKKDGGAETKKKKPSAKGRRSLLSLLRR